ncbi:MAG TPA: hypothetical protein ENJ28_10025 [Gammaproteobacteria bacterium]|nr:hypothetical protein [Gammaproteobacteria bacterium]
MFRVLVVTAIAVGAFLIKGNKNNKTIFISYRYVADGKYKNLLKAWSKNSIFKLDFDDYSTDVSINSNNKSVVRRVVSSKIKKSDVFMCIVGESTHKSSWVEWEINKAVELGKSIVAVKTKKKNKTPAALKNNGVSWAMSFKEKSIMNAINECL